MPIDLPTAIDTERNSDDGSSPWLWCLDWVITGVGTLRFVNNNENVTYQGNVYTSLNFNLGPWESLQGGEIPRRTLSITNADLVNTLHPYVRDNSGVVDSVVTATPVFAGSLASDMSDKAVDYTVISTSAAEDYIAFTLGAPNPLYNSFPDGKYFADYCRFVKHFKGVECGYTGVDSTCDGTFADCYSKSNQTRYGGCLTLRAKTVRFA